MTFELNIGTVTNDKKYKYSTVDLAHSLNVILERQHSNVTWQVATGNGDWGEELTIVIRLSTYSLTALQEDLTALCVMLRQDAIAWYNPDTDYGELVSQPFVKLDYEFNKEYFVRYK